MSEDSIGPSIFPIVIMMTAVVIVGIVFVGIFDDLNVQTEFKDKEENVSKTESYSSITEIFRMIPSSSTFLPIVRRIGGIVIFIIICFGALKGPSSSDDEEDYEDTEEYLYCKYCGDEYSKEELKEHEDECKTDWDIKEHGIYCNYCGDSFDRKTELTNHLKTCEEKPIEKVKEVIETVEKIKLTKEQEKEIEKRMKETKPIEDLNKTEFDI
jgi:uncharacterized membrane protein